jgi:hypothetical protein
MATITLKYDSRNLKAKKAIDFLLSLDLFETNDNISAIDKSLQDVKLGKVKKYNSVSDYFKKIG